MVRSILHLWLLAVLGATSVNAVYYGHEHPGYSKKPKMCRPRSSHLSVSVSPTYVSSSSSTTSTTPSSSSPPYVHPSYPTSSPPYVYPSSTPSYMYPSEPSASSSVASSTPGNTYPSISSAEPSAPVSTPESSSPYTSPELSTGVPASSTPYYYPSSYPVYSSPESSVLAASSEPVSSAVPASSSPYSDPVYTYPSSSASVSEPVSVISSAGPASSKTPYSDPSSAPSSSTPYYYSSSTPVASSVPASSFPYYSSYPAESSAAPSSPPASSVPYLPSYPPKSSIPCTESSVPVVASSAPSSDPGASSMPSYYYSSSPAVSSAIPASSAPVVASSAPSSLPVSSVPYYSSYPPKSTPCPESSGYVVASSGAPSSNPSVASSLPSYYSPSSPAASSSPIVVSSLASSGLSSLPVSYPGSSLVPSSVASSAPASSAAPSYPSYLASSSAPVYSSDPGNSYPYYYPSSSIPLGSSAAPSSVPSSAGPSAPVSASGPVSTAPSFSSGPVSSVGQASSGPAVASSGPAVSSAPASSAPVTVPATSAPVSSAAEPPVPASSAGPISSVAPPPSSVSVYPSSSRPYQSGYPSNTFCRNNPSNRQCWWPFNIDTDYYKNTPNTGRTVTYNLSVDNVILSPDGVAREMMVYNGQFPGPLIEANWGDTLVIHVKNNLTNGNGTSVHWHGILMEHNVANDGVPGVTQCPIPPGETFTYTFRCTSYGTTWYHSHFSLQYSDGLVGPLVIHGPSSANWDFDLGPVMVQDWYHTPAFEDWFSVRSAGPPPGDNGLFNGKNKLNDGGEYAEFKNLIPGKKYRIRLINSSTDQHFKFWIDQHKLTVQAADFVAVEPYETEVLDIAIGQRYDLVFTADQNVDNYWMRVAPATECSANNNADGIRAIMRYVGADDTAEPTSTPHAFGTECIDEVGLVPVVKRNVGNFAYGNQMDVGIIFDNYIKFTLNGSSLFLDWKDPTLLMVENFDPSYPSAYNVISLNGTAETWQYFVIQSTGVFALNHPIHLHGHDFITIASGKGVFDETALQNAQLINPPRRDVVTLPASAPGDPVGGYLVIAFPLDNPGIWILHCHIAWHVAQGLGMQFVERMSEIPGNVGVTPAWEQMCQAWNDFEISAAIPRDDSGV